MCNSSSPSCIPVPQEKTALTRGTSKTCSSVNCLTRSCGTKLVNSRVYYNIWCTDTSQLCSSVCGCPRSRGGKIITSYPSTHCTDLGQRCHGVVDLISTRQYTSCMCPKLVYLPKLPAVTGGELAVPRRAYTKAAATSAICGMVNVNTRVWGTVTSTHSSRCAPRCAGE